MAQSHRSQKMMPFRNIVRQVLTTQRASKLILINAARRCRTHSAAIKRKHPAGDKGEQDVQEDHRSG
jgi:hypothetical protein